MGSGGGRVMALAVWLVGSVVFAIGWARLKGGH